MRARTSLNGTPLTVRARSKGRYTVQLGRCYYGKPLQGEAAVPCSEGQHCMHWAGCGAYTVVTRCCRCDWEWVEKRPEVTQ